MVTFAMVVIAFHQGTKMVTFVEMMMAIQRGLRGPLGNFGPLQVPFLSLICGWERFAQSVGFCGLVFRSQEGHQGQVSVLHQKYHFQNVQQNRVSKPFAPVFSPGPLVVV